MILSSSCARRRARSATFLSSCWLCATPPRFAEAELPRVQAQLETFFAQRDVALLVGSAACGADILILELAAKHNIATRIILPFEAARFRRTSVIDRGEAWGPRFDAVVDYAQHNGAIVVLDPGDGGEDAAYSRVTEQIVATAARCGQEPDRSALALAVWDQHPRTQADATLEFIELARRWQLPVEEIATI